MKTIVDSLGGTIDFQSTIGEGTCFRVCLPSKPYRGTCDMSLGSVLIADDEETFRESTSRLLRREGFECQCVEDTNETVKSLRHDRFDLLIADIRMPHNPDLRVVREARELDRHLPIILVTGVSVGGHGDPRNRDGRPRLSDQTGGLRGTAGPRAWRGRADLIPAAGPRASSSGCVRSWPIWRPRTAVSLSCGDMADESALATIRTLASCLSDLLVLWHKPAADHGLVNLCDLLDCPQRPAHRQAILHAIEVLEKTKDSFKSKQLAELRVKLEHAVGIK